MKNQKDIFDLFRENQHKLNQRPSPKTWKRLERRLDRPKRGSGPHRLYQLWSMAAALLLLLGVLMLVSSMLKKEEHYLAVNLAKPATLEDLVYIDSNPEAYKVAEFTRQYHDRANNPIQEGASDQKLLPSKLPALINNNTTETIAQNEADSETIVEVEQNSKLQFFNWLLGNWEGEVPASVNSLETWEVFNKYTIQGTGKIVEFEDTSLVEQMLIQQIGEEVYYFSLNLQEDKKPVWYKLKTINKQKAIFENPKAPKPSTVIIQLNPDSSYSTTYQLEDSLALQTKQIKWLEQRNQLVDITLKRNMVRS